MDAVRDLSTNSNAITCIDMHTTGEPTRIVISGYPKLSGTLLEQRAEAKQHHDHIRRRLLLEPRGHRDMYGAVLRADTEYTKSGKAHMGVLFLANDGYSTMCGHATIALGRFLVDTWDLDVFPKRKEVKVEGGVARVVLHAPCGLVEVDVAVNKDGRSDPQRPVGHVSVASFATGVGVAVDVKGDEYVWPELGERTSVVADFAFGGAFFCFVAAKALGFKSGLGGKGIDLSAINTATKRLKAAINGNPKLRHLFSHPEHAELGFLYSIIVVDTDVGVPIAQSTKAETGLCFFADQQIDRSPTGSGTAARVALACAKSPSAPPSPTTYHSLLSNSLGGRGGFVGSFHEEVGKTADGLPIVRVRVEGYASYTGTSTFVVEQSDALDDDGFLLERLAVGSSMNPPRG